MKKLLFVLFISPLMLFGQKSSPRFENDTLYTSCGFKIYKGQTLKFSRGTGLGGSFRYIRLASGWHESILTNNQCVVKKLKRYNITSLGNAYIFVVATLTYKDGSKGDINFNMAFDHAIEGTPGFISSEVIVPEEFKNKPNISVSDEISKLYKLYQDSILSKEEFEIQKKKLLAQ